MATLSIKYLATSVKMQMRVQVFVPASIVDADARPFRVLWLLHPEGGDDTDWLRLSMVEHAAQAANVALVMPDLENSMGMDMAHGGYPYFEYLAQDLPSHVRNLVRVLSPHRDDNFVAGAGTGGYGALKWALRAPDRFAAVACFSADVDIVAALREMEASGPLPDAWAAAFGSSSAIAGTADDTVELCRQRLQAGEPLPAIHVALNDREPGFARMRKGAASLRDLGANVVFHETSTAPGWTSWDVAARRFIGDVVRASE